MRCFLISWLRFLNENCLIIDLFFLKNWLWIMAPHCFGFFDLGSEWMVFISWSIDTWNNDATQETHGMLSFKKKLQNLKKVLRSWNGENSMRDKGIKVGLLKYISDIDLQVDKGEATKVDMELRLRFLIWNVLGELERVEAMDLAQKAKIRWDIEGDENTKFFHGILKKKRRQLAIRGIMSDDNWIIEPNQVKNDFF